MFKTKAFSLIEMMFVIIIIALISVYAVNVVNKRAENTLATKTAAQIQQWFQAAQNYYTTNQTWPTSWNEISGVSDQGVYLPASAQCSPILNSGSNSSCGNYGYFHLYLPSGDNPAGQPYSADNSPFIYLETQVPNEVVGKQIASMLPNGVYGDCSSGYNSSSDDLCVSGSAVLPGNLSAPQAYIPTAQCSITRCDSSVNIGVCFNSTVSITNVPASSTTPSRPTYCICTNGNCSWTNHQYPS